MVSYTVLPNGSRIPSIYGTSDLMCRYTVGIVSLEHETPYTTMGYGRYEEEHVDIHEVYRKSMIRDTLHEEYLEEDLYEEEDIQQVVNLLVWTMLNSNSPMVKRYCYKVIRYTLGPVPVAPT